MGGAGAGISAARPLENELHLHELNVRSAAQRKGIGGALLFSLAEHASAAGFQAITLNTLRCVPWNAPFYAGRGFAEVDVEQHPRLATAP